MNYSSIILFHKMPFYHPNLLRAYLNVLNLLRTHLRTSLYKNVTHLNINDLFLQQRSYSTRQSVCLVVLTFDNCQTSNFLKSFSIFKACPFVLTRQFGIFLSNQACQNCPIDFELSGISKLVTRQRKRSNSIIKTETCEFPL